MSVTTKTLPITPKKVSEISKVSVKISSRVSLGVFMIPRKSRACLSSRCFLFLALGSHSFQDSKQSVQINLRKKARNFEVATASSCRLF